MLINQDLSEVKSGLDFESIPTGVYKAQLTEVREMYLDTPEDGIKHSLSLTWTVMDGDYSEAKVFDRLFLQGYSPKSLVFHKRKLKTIAEAVGHRNPNFVQDTDELIQKPCQIKVGFGKGDFSEKNEIKNYYPMGIKVNGTAKQAVPAVPASSPAKTPPPNGNGQKQAATPPPATAGNSQPPPKSHTPAKADIVPDLAAVKNDDGRRNCFEVPPDGVGPFEGGADAGLGEAPF
jgi:hypothetical protein